MDANLAVTPASVAETREWLIDRDEQIVHLINRVRDDLGGVFEVTIDPVTTEAYRAEVATIFAEGDLAANITAMVGFLRSLDVTNDHPGFIVDEIVGRELAGMIAGSQPLRMLAEATFHYADATHHPSDTSAAGSDDLDAAIAAGFQTRLPGWPWQAAEGPFDDLPS